MENKEIKKTCPPRYGECPFTHYVITKPMYCPTCDKTVHPTIISY